MIYSNLILRIIPSILLIIWGSQSYSQIAPSRLENIDFLITFGQNASTEWGDDDYTQVHFFLIPKIETKPIFIRLFDPNTGGKHDTKNTEYNTTCTYTLYGGKGTHSPAAAKGINPINGYDAGAVLKTKSFSNENTFDDKWYTFGPINPSEGEYSEEFKGYIFKVICKGGKGDDGNAYRYSLSYQRDENIAVQGGNIFTYEMSFKLKKLAKNTAHIYPFITENMKSITQFNFDSDDDLYMRVTSVGRKLVRASVSLNDNWMSTKFEILEVEKKTTMDIQLIKKSDSNNDMVIYLKNQYDEAVPLFSSPIGGKPSYLYSVKIKRKF